MLVLPEEHRGLFKEPFGTLHQSIEDVLPLIQGMEIYTVGDVVTHNVRKKGLIPAVAIVDGYSMRSPCVRTPVIVGNCFRVKNPAGTITDSLIRALECALDSTPSTIIVDGEEDLAVIPLVLRARDDTFVLYGQPHRGVVLRRVDQEARSIAQKLLTYFIREDD